VKLQATLSEVMGKIKELNHGHKPAYPVLLSSLLLHSQVIECINLTLKPVTEDVCSNNM
jgi:hypothetical protein